MAAPSFTKSAGFSTGGRGAPADLRSRRRRCNSFHARRLAVRVADSGAGLPAEAVEHLFEPFATNGKKQGTGLGLVTVRNLVKAHGGEVRVEAKAPEGGAAFTVLLPLVAAAGAAARVA